MAKACSSSANISLKYLCHISIFTYHLLEMPTRILKKKKTSLQLTLVDYKTGEDYRTSVSRF